MVAGVVLSSIALLNEIDTLRVIVHFIGFAHTVFTLNYYIEESEKSKNS